MQKLAVDIQKCICTKFELGIHFADIIICKRFAIGSVCRVCSPGAQPWL